MELRDENKELPFTGTRFKYLTFAHCFDPVSMSLGKFARAAEVGPVNDVNVKIRVPYSN